MRKYCCVILAAALFCTSGCAKKAEPVKAVYYPACHEPLAYLDSRGGTGRGVARGAVQGGVISGIASAILSAITGNISGTGVAVSVGVGSVLGGTLGGASASSVQQKEDNQHLAKYLEQIDGDIEGMDIVTAAATVSRQCYGREFKQLMASMAQGKISVDAARVRFAEIEAGETEAAGLLKEPAGTQAQAEEFERVAGRLAKTARK